MPSGIWVTLVSVGSQQRGYAEQSGYSLNHKGKQILIKLGRKVFVVVIVVVLFYQLDNF